MMNCAFCWVKLSLIAILLLTVLPAVNSQPEEGTIITVAGGGSGGDGIAINGSLNRPIGMSFDLSGNLIFADSGNRLIRKLDVSSGMISTIAGTGNPAFGGDNGPALNAFFYNPEDVAIDNLGNIFIADSENNRIRKINNQTGIITTVAGSGNRSYSGDEDLAINASFSFPMRITIDRNNNIYVVDKGNNRIRRIDSTTQIITTVAGTGQNASTGDGGLAIYASISNPTGLAFDRWENLYIAQESYVRKIDAVTRIITTIAGNGIDGYAGDGEAALNASLWGHHNITVDSVGNIYLAEDNTSRVRKIDAMTGIIDTIAGNGAHGYAGEGIQATSTSLYWPRGVEIDNEGNLFIADTQNDRIRKVYGVAEPLVTNTPPVAFSQTITVPYQSSTPIILSATDAENDTLIYVVSNPLHGFLSGTAPNLTYNALAAYSGPDQFGFSVSDGTVNSNTATVYITVNSGNEPPTAYNKSLNTNEDTTVLVTLSGSDPEGSTLTYIVGNPAYGSLSGTAPNLTYTPSANYNGLDTFTYKVNDGIVDSVSATVSIIVNPVNDAPTADDKTITTLEDTLQSVTLSGADTENSPLTYTVVTQPSYGTLSGTAPNLTYTPTVNYHGSDSFTYKVNDGTVDSAYATASITITSANSSPIIDLQYTPSLTPILEDQFNNAGNTVGDIVINGSITDSDGGAVEAIAVTGVDNTFGKWEYDSPSRLSFYKDTHVMSIYISVGLIVSPDGKHAYGTSKNNNLVGVFSRDVLTGDLTQLVQFQLINPLNLTISPNGKNVYIVAIGGIRVYERNEETGLLTWIETKTYETDHNGMDVVVSPDGKHVYVTEKGPFHTGLVAAFQRDIATGTLTFIEKYTGLPNPSKITISPDGQHIYIADNWNGVHVFSRIETTGHLAKVELEAVGNEDVEISPDGKFVYVTDYYGNKISVLSRDLSTGALTLIESVPAGGPEIIIFSPDGNDAYVTGGFRVDHFSRNPDTGLITYVETKQDNFDGVQMGNPSNLAISPDNQHLYVWGPSLTIFNIDGGFVEFSSGTGFVNLSGVSRLLNRENKIRFIPNPNFNGTSTLTFRAWDKTSGSSGSTADTTINGGISAFSQAEETIIVTVSPVNDAPSFVVGPNIAVPINTGSQEINITNWATSITPGPADEANQSLTFTVTVHNQNNLFAVQPAISPTGTLTFTSLINTLGTTTATVQLMDDGGTMNGGGATSSLQDFTITIVPDNMPSPTPTEIPTPSSVSMITLTHPNGGETFTGGTTTQIQYTSQNVSVVNLYYTVGYMNSGMPGWTPIASGQIASGTYDWHIPDLPAINSVRIRVEDANNIAVSDESDSYFTVMQAPPTSTPTPSPTQGPSPTPTLTPIANPCDYKVKWVQNPNNGHWYGSTASYMTWDEAENVAKAYGGHLVTINDAAENLWVQNALSTFSNMTPPMPNEHWIGLRGAYDGMVTTWSWISGEPLIYQNWSMGYTPWGQFATMSPDGKWYSQSGPATSTRLGLIEVNATLTWYEPAQSTVIKGANSVIDQDTTWRRTDSPYIIEGNVIVNSGSTLTVEPGTQILFKGDYNIYVQGAIQAVGIPAEKVTFTMLDSSFPCMTWGKIILMGSQPSQFVWCDISKANTGVYVKTSNAYTFENSRFSDCYQDGIYFETSPYGLSFVGCDFLNNGRSGLNARGGNFTIQNCRFNSNVWNGLQADLYSSTIVNCEFSYNKNTGLEGGINSSVINNCQFLYNNGSGVYTYYSGNNFQSCQFNSNGRNGLETGSSSISYCQASNNALSGMRIGLQGGNFHHNTVSQNGEHGVYFSNVNNSTVTSSSILNNQLSGLYFSGEVLSATFTTLNIYSNQSYAVENRWSSFFDMRDVYWGPSVTQEMIDKGPAANISAIYDINDNPSSGWVLYSNYRSTEVMYPLEPSPTPVPTPTATPWINSPPVAMEGYYTVNEGSSVAIILSATDPDWQALSYSIMNWPSHGMLTGTGPNYNYYAYTGYSGPDQFIFSVNDGMGGSDSATVYITILAAEPTATPTIPIVPNGDYSVYLNGVDQYLYIEDSAQTFLDLSGDLTIEGWFKLDEAPVNRIYTLASKYRYQDNNRSYSLQYVDDNGSKYINFFVSNDGTANSEHYIYYNLEPNVWRHLSVSLDSDGGITNGTARFYIDGIHIGSANGTKAYTSINNSAAPFTVGASNINNFTKEEFFKGYIDDLRVWEGIRSASEIQSNYNRELTGSEPYLRAYWKFDGNTNDSTINQNHLLNQGAIFVSDTWNHPPIAHNQYYSVNQYMSVPIILSASDVENNPLSYSIVRYPNMGTLSGMPPYMNYQPYPAFSGTDSFTFKANDGIADSNIATVTITVNPAVNPPMLMMPIPDVAVSSNSTSSTVFLPSYFSGTGLSYSITNSHPAVVSTYIMGSDLIINYLQSQSFTANVTVTASNAGGMVSDTFTVTMQSSGSISDEDIQRILDALQLNRMLIGSSTQIILDTLNSGFGNLLVCKDNLASVTAALEINNSLIQSASSSILNAIAASRYDIGMASASLHNRMNGLQNQLANSTAILSASISAIEVPSFPTSDLLREINENEAKIDEASRALNLRIGGVGESVLTGQQALLDAINRSRDRIESASDAILREIRGIHIPEMPWDEFDLRLEELNQDLSAQSVEIQAVSRQFKIESAALVDEIRSNKTTLSAELSTAKQEVLNQTAATINSLADRVVQSATSILDAVDSLEVPVEAVANQVQDVSVYLDGKLSAAQNALSSDISQAKTSLQMSLNQNTAVVQSASGALSQKIDSLSPSLADLKNEINQNENLIGDETDRVLDSLQSQSDFIQSASEQLTAKADGLLQEVQSGNNSILSELTNTQIGLNNRVDAAKNSLADRVVQSTTAILDAVNSIEFPVEAVTSQIRDASAFLDERLNATQVALASEIIHTETSLQAALNQNANIVQSAREALSQKVDSLNPALTDIKSEINQNETLIGNGTGQILGQIQNQSGLIQSASKFVESEAEDIQSDIASSQTSLLSGLESTEQSINSTLGDQEGALSGRIGDSAASILEAVDLLHSPLASLLTQIEENQTRIADASRNLDIRIADVGQIVQSSQLSLLNAVNGNRDRIESASDSIVREIHNIQIPEFPLEELRVELNEIDRALLAQSVTVNSASAQLNAKADDITQKIQSSKNAITTELSDAKLEINNQIAAARDSLADRVVQSATAILDAVDAIEFPVDAVASQIRGASAFLDERLNATEIALASEITHTEASLQEALNQNANVVQSASQTLSQKIISLNPALADIKNEINQNESLIGDGTNRIEDQLQAQTDLILSASKTAQSETEQLQVAIESNETSVLSDLANAKENITNRLNENTMSLADQVIRSTTDVLEALDAIELPVDVVVAEINDNEDLINTSTTQIMDRLLSQTGRIQSASEYVESLVEDLRGEISSSENSVLSGLEGAEQRIQNTIESMQPPLLSLLPEINENQAKIAEATEYLKTQVHSSELSLLNALSGAQSTIASVSAAILQRIGLSQNSLLGQLLSQSALIQSASEFLDNRFALVGTNLESIEQQILLDLQTRTDRILAEVNQNEATIDSASDSIGARIDNLLLDQTAIGGLLIGMEMHVGQILQTLDSFNERDIEDHLARNDVLVRLYVPAANGGELENVAALVSARIQLVESLGLSSRNARTFYNNGVNQFNNKNYYDAFANFSQAYRELTKAPK